MQPISIELLPTGSRTSVVVLVQSDAPIPGLTLVEALRNFVSQLESKLKPKIEMPPAKKIVTL